jgi:hypothetical protein
MSNCDRLSAVKPSASNSDGIPSRTAVAPSRADKPQVSRDRAIPVPVADKVVIHRQSVLPFGDRPAKWGSAARGRLTLGAHRRGTCTSVVERRVRPDLRGDRHDAGHVADRVPLRRRLRQHGRVRHRRGLPQLTGRQLRPGPGPLGSHRVPFPGRRRELPVQDLRVAGRLGIWDEGAVHGDRDDQRCERRQTGRSSTTTGWGCRAT